MNDLLHVDVVVESHRVLVRPVGAVDMATAPQLGRALQQALSHEADETVVDLEAVSYLASSGMTVLLDARSDADRRRSAFVILCQGNRLVRQVLAITGIDKVIAVRPTRDATSSEGDTDRHEQPASG